MSTLTDRTVLLEGSHAIAEAAIQAGCRFYAGYPITPSTEILEYMSHRLPQVGGTCMNAESELEGRVALRNQGWLEHYHLPCLNDSPALTAAFARQVVGAAQGA